MTKPKNLGFYTQNKNLLIQPIYCINQPIRGIDLAMTKNWLIRAKNWLYLPIDISGRLVENNLKERFFGPG
jgi:hypothetical protein